MENATIRRVIVWEVLIVSKWKELIKERMRLDQYIDIYADCSSDANEIE